MVANVIEEDGLFCIPIHDRSDTFGSFTRRVAREVFYERVRRVRTIIY